MRATTKSGGAGVAMVTLILGAWLLGTAPACSSRVERGPPPATLRVAGMSWLRDRELRVSLERLLGDARGETLGANAVEDAMFLLMSAVQSAGFLKPVIEGTKVTLKLKGACGCCPHAQMTLKNGIERILREQVSTDIVVERAA